MKRIFFFAVFTSLFSCSTPTNQNSGEADNSQDEKIENAPPINLLRAYQAFVTEETVNAVIEIPTGTTGKWEVN